MAFLFLADYWSAIGKNERLNQSQRRRVIRSRPHALARTGAQGAGQQRQFADDHADDTDRPLRPFRYDLLVGGKILSHYGKETNEGGGLKCPPACRFV